MNKTYYCLLSAVLVLAASQASAKSPSMVFSGDTIVNGTIEVPESTTVIIKPGVTFRFSGVFKFIVRGTLIAEGTENQPIVFTCVGRLRGATGEPCWYGIAIIGKKSCAMLRHCRVEGAYRTLVWEADPVFDSCEFTGNHCGLYCTKKAVAHVKYCRFHRNVYGIVADFANPLLLDNIITDNAVGVSLQAGAKLGAGKNTISGNQTNVKAEECLKGDTSASPVRDLWDLMNRLE